MATGSYTTPNMKTNVDRPYPPVDTKTPIPRTITEADAHAEPPAERLMANKPRGRLRTAFEYRGYHLTITARGMTLAAFYAAIETDPAYPFTVGTGVAHDGRFTEIEFEDMTINDFCDMLDRKFGVAK